MKSVGIMTLKQVRDLANTIVNSAPVDASVTIRETSSTLVVSSAKGTLMRAVWRIKSQCGVQAVDGLIIKEQQQGNINHA